MSLADALDTLREADQALQSGAAVPLPVIGLEAVVAGAVAVTARGARGGMATAAQLADIG